MLSNILHEVLLHIWFCVFENMIHNFKYCKWLVRFILRQCLQLAESQVLQSGQLECSSCIVDDTRANSFFGTNSFFAYVFMYTNSRFQAYPFSALIHNIWVVFTTLEVLPNGQEIIFIQLG